MAGSIVPVKAGRNPTQISGSDLRDTTIYNTSSTEAVWIGNSNSLVPNLGMRIGPLGTARWAKEAGLAWACVDTGVATPINLNVSNDITDPTNPVDVATAVATALLAQGIPNVLTTEILFSGALSDFQSTGNLDVSGQASLAILLNGGNLADSVGIHAQFTDAGGLAEEDFGLTAVQDSATTGALAKWNMPVTQPLFNAQAFTDGAGLITLVIIGSNRIVPKLSQAINSYLPRILNFTGAFVAGAFHKLTSADSSSDKAVTRFNGPISITCNGNAAATTAGFTITCTWLDIDFVSGALVQRNFQFLPHFSANVTFDFNHPSVPCFWQAQAFANAAACSVTLQIVPAGAGL